MFVFFGSHEKHILFPPAQGVFSKIYATISEEIENCVCFPISRSIYEMCDKKNEEQQTKYAIFW